MPPPPWAPSGEDIIFDSERNSSGTGDQSIYRMAPDGSNVRQLARLQGVTSWLPDWSPDRKRIVFSSNRTGPWDDLYVMDADGGKMRQLTDTPEASEHDAAWSPDGRHIAYDRAEIAADRTRQAAQIWIIDTDGSNARALTSGSSRNMRPAWSPDGSIIAFMSDRHAESDINLMGTDDGDLEIYVMKRDGSNIRRLTECAGTARSPAWSPDGQRIALDCGGLHVMNADGSNQRRVSRGGYRPAWSPDGKEIAYNCNPYSQASLIQFEQFEICVIRVDGSAFRTLTKNAVFDGHPD
jgi:TolB protein